MLIKTPLFTILEVPEICGDDVDVDEDEDEDEEGGRGRGVMGREMCDEGGEG